MRRFVALCVGLACLLSLCACGGRAGEPQTATVAPDTKPAPTIAVVEGQAVEQLDDVSVYIPAVGESKNLEGLPAYIYSEGEKVAYKGMKKGRYEQETHIFNNTDAASFITYLQALEADGWVQYSNNIIDGVNLFATYTKDGGSVYCYYIPTKNRTLIIRSPHQNLETKEQEFEAVCQTQLTQVGMLHELWPGGMSYVVRLSDGRFVIIDGGYTEADYYEARHLYDLMTEQNVLEHITVAAWIITHPHKDHLGAASDFLRYYNPSQVEIQQMIFNFPPDDVLLTVDEQIVTDTSDPSKMPTFLMALESMWPEVPVTVCHTGQRYRFADATFEILHTFEDFYPQDLIMQSQDPVNGASVIVSMEVDGQKTLFLADSARDCSADMVKMWGGYLKSDIMQAAHHGLNGGSVALYQAIDPQVVLVPSVARYVKKILEFSHSQWLWNNESGNIREVIVSDWGERTMTLPYSPLPDAPYFATTGDPWDGLESKYKNP